MKREILGLAAAAVLLFGSGCSPNAPALDPQLQLQAQVVLGALKGLPDVVAHTGTRRVRSLRQSRNVFNEVEYREEVRVASSGNYQVECLDVLASNFADPIQFVAMQNGREGFVHRYRDFRIRDVQLLLENYVVVQIGTPMVVAGRSCFSLVLVRRDDPRYDEPVVSWSLAIDVESGLVLRWRRGSNGRATDEGEYESLVYGEPSQFTPHVATNQEVVVTPQTDLRRTFDFDLTTPTLLPIYFVRSERASVVDGLGQTWLKETFTDGIEAVFFLFRQDAGGVAAPKSGLTSTGRTVTAGTVSGSTPSGAAAGSVATTSSGSAAPALAEPVLKIVAHGEFVLAEYSEPQRVGIVVGRLELDDAQWMVESALH